MLLQDFIYDFSQIGIPYDNVDESFLIEPKKWDTKGISRFMKVMGIKDIDKFFEVVDSCKGKVELVTGEGDRLNLKSKLSQYVSLANIFSNGEIPELEIVAYEKEDIDKLMDYMISRNN